MPNVAVQKTNEPGGTRLPVFEELERRFENIRQRAFELFEGRKEWFGRELDDWLQAEREVLGAPAAELAEKEGAYEIQVALPGFEPKDVEVTATPGEIVVKAATKEETKREEKGKVLWTEFGTREIYRRFELPEATDAEKVAAKLENGILRITAPKAPAVAEHGPRKVAIAA